MCVCMCVCIIHAKVCKVFHPEAVSLQYAKAYL